jgi:hypothetical protein
LEGLTTEYVGIFNGLLVYFTAIWYISSILWSFGNFFQFWYFVPREIWQPWKEPGGDFQNFGGKVLAHSNNAA